MNWWNHRFSQNMNKKNLPCDFMNYFWNLLTFSNTLFNAMVDYLFTRFLKISNEWFLKTCCRFTKFLHFNLQDGLWSKCCKQPKIRGRQCYFSNWGFGPKCSSGRTQCVIFIEIIFSRASRPTVHLQVVRRIFGGCQSSRRFETECNETSSQSFIERTFQVNYFLKLRYSEKSKKFEKRNYNHIWYYLLSSVKRKLGDFFKTSQNIWTLPGPKEIYKDRIFSLRRTKNF